MDIAAQAVEPGNDQRCLALAAGGQRLRQFRTIRAFAALDFDELVEQFPAAAVEEVLDGLALSLDAKTRASL